MIRYNPNINIGLNQNQVNYRIKNKETLKTIAKIKNEKETNFVVNNYITQSQNQDNRQLAVITESDKELVKPRSGIMSKLKASCYTIITGVLVDVLGDLDFWQWLHYHLELILGCILL